MIFLSLDEFQAERFLKVAAETISPPYHQPSPSAVTEGGDMPDETPKRHNSTSLPTNPHSREATATAGDPLRWPGCTSVVPTPCDEQTSISASVSHSPLCPRKDALSHPHNMILLSVPLHWFSLHFGESYSDVYPQTRIQVLQA